MSNFVDSLNTEILTISSIAQIINSYHNLHCLEFSVTSQLEPDSTSQISVHT